LIFSIFVVRDEKFFLMKTDRQNERIVELNLSTGLQCITDVFLA